MKLNPNSNCKLLDEETVSKMVQAFADGIADTDTKDFRRGWQYYDDPLSVLPRCYEYGITVGKDWKFLASNDA